VNLEQRLRQIQQRGKTGTAKGLGLALEHMLGVSNDHVPHEEGTLERSGKTGVDEQALRGGVGYDTPYAVIQHEDMTLRHDPGRNAKFLENALNGERDTAGKLIATAIERELES
jgi:hypothetical protein